MRTTFHFLASRSKISQQVPNAMNISHTLYQSQIHQSTWNICTQLTRRLTVTLQKETSLDCVSQTTLPDRWKIHFWRNGIEIQESNGVEVSSFNPPNYSSKNSVILCKELHLDYSTTGSDIGTLVSWQASMIHPYLEEWCSKTKILQEGDKIAKSIYLVLFQREIFIKGS